MAAKDMLYIIHLIVTKEFTQCWSGVVGDQSPLKKSIPKKCTNHWLQMLRLKVASENVVNYHVFQIQMAKCHRRPAIVLFRLIR